ncbi:MAG: hypothetical protein QW507_00580 [Candidatus Nanoarchaeia archaeon]|nr:hypothetical protein [Candidatus Haiyanarchaeum thermophilum]MCW1307207.1 hypothetical protein [Candidatus Haiyanarchaeum thermophilum]MCW1308495.1 hypothetical protein [Candidatus Haiyanarchaeum thermophilum]
MKELGSLLILLILLGCIQITPSPPSGGAIYGGISVYMYGPKRVKRGETFELRVQVTNNFSATLKNVRAFLYSPDISVSLLQQRIDLGDLISGTSNEGYVNCALNTKAYPNMEYKIYGKICVDREVEGYHEIIIASDPSMVNTKPHSSLDKEIISVSFIGIENVFSPVHEINFTIKLKNELSGEITSKEVGQPCDSIIKEIEIRVPRDDIIASLYAFQRYGKVIDGNIRVRLSYQNESDRLLLQLKESKEIRAYISLREEILEMLKSVNFISFPVYFGLNYTYCVEAPAFTFTSY